MIPDQNPDSISSIAELLEAAREIHPEFNSPEALLDAARTVAFLQQAMPGGDIRTHPVSKVGSHAYEAVLEAERVSGITHLVANALSLAETGKAERATKQLEHAQILTCSQGLRRESSPVRLTIEPVEPVVAPEVDSGPDPDP
jgi:hypothetical protein